MDKITTVGLDLAKQVMAVHGVDAMGRMVMRKVLRRDQVLTWSATSTTSIRTGCRSWASVKSLI